MDPARFDEMRPGCFDIEARVADMDRAGIWASLCFPSLVSGFCGAVYSRAEDPALGLACLRAFNDWHLEAWAGTAPRADHPAAAAVAGRRRGGGVGAARQRRPRVQGGELPRVPGPARLPSIFSGRWDPFFAACEETDTVVCLHTGSSAWAPLPSPDPPFELLPTLFPVNALLAAGEWLWSGVPLRFPGLKIALSEGGIGWVPMLMDRADYVVGHSASGRESTAWPTTLLPSEVLRRNFWFCSIDDPSAVVQRHVIGVDHIMVESDYPHADSTWPDTQRVLAADLGRAARGRAARRGRRERRRALPPPAPRSATTGARRWRDQAPGPSPLPPALRAGRRRRRPRRRARGGVGGTARRLPAHASSADGHGYEHVTVGGTEILAVPLGTLARPGSRFDDPAAFRPLAEAQPGGADPVARLADMDTEGIDQAVLYPTIGLYFARSPTRPRRCASPPPTTTGWPATAAPGPRRLFGAAMLPLQDPPAAARELRRAVGELGFVAGFVRPNPCLGRSLCHRAYDTAVGRGRGARRADRDPRGQFGDRADARPPTGPSTRSCCTPCRIRSRRCSPARSSSPSASSSATRAALRLLGVLGRMGSLLARAPGRAGGVVRRLLPGHGAEPVGVLRPAVRGQLRGRRAHPARAGALRRSGAHRVGQRLPAPRRHLPRSGRRHPRHRARRARPPPRPACSA